MSRTDKTPQIMSAVEAVGNAGRSAHASIRGYLTQILYTAAEWVVLPENQVLIVEGREDIDRAIFDEDGHLKRFEEVQIKDYAEPINIRSKAAWETLFNFLVSFHHHRKDGLQCRFVFSTTAVQKGQQTAKSTDVDLDSGPKASRKLNLAINVIDQWKRLPDIASTEKSTEIQGDLVGSVRALFSMHLQRFLNVAEDAPDSENNRKAKRRQAIAVQGAISWIDEKLLWNDFLESITWRFDQAGYSDIRRELEESCLSNADLNNLPIDLCIDCLVLKIFEAASKKEVIDRVLTRADLEELINQNLDTLELWAKQRGMAHFPGWAFVAGELEDHRERIETLEEGLQAHNQRLEKLEGQGGLRQFFRLPQQNPFFSGRVQILDRLMGQFKQDNGAACIQTIWGLGGTGKTEIALKLCYLSRDEYPGGIFWADASSQTDLQKSFAAFARQNLEIPIDTPTTEAAEAWVSSCELKTGWLLVLNNLDDLRDFRSIFPEGHTGHILITTRHNDPNFPGYRVQLNSWGMDEAVEFLKKRLKREVSDDEYQDLGHALGCLPLAVDQAAAYLSKHPMVKVDTYTQRFSEERIKFLEKYGGNTLESQGRATVGATWQISIEKLDCHAAAREAFEGFAFFTPERIPLRIFQNIERLGPNLKVINLQDEIVLSEQIIAPLQEYSLVKFEGTDGGMFSIHRLLQDVVLSDLKENGTADQILSALHLTVEELLPEKTSRPKSWPEVEPLLSQTRRFLELFEENSDYWGASWEPTSLWVKMGTFAGATGRHEIAEQFERAAWEYRRTHPDKYDDEILFRTSNNLSVSLWRREKFEEAQELRRQQIDSVEIDSRFHLKARSAYADNQRYLAEDMEEQERKVVLAEARTTLEEVLRKQVEEFGEDFEDSLETLNSLAEISDPPKRLELHQRAFDIRIANDRAQTEPETLTTLHNLADAHWKCGNRESACSRARQAFELKQSILGAKHPSTLISWFATCLYRKESGEVSPEFKEECQELLETTNEVLPRESSLHKAVAHHFGG